MSRPPQKLPMGRPLEESQAKPPVPGQMPGQPSGPQHVSPHPTKPIKPTKGGGSSIVLILLAVFGGMGLLVLLACGGFVWYVSSEVQKDLARQDAERAAAQARAGGNNQRPNPAPWRPPTPRPSPNAQSINSLETAAAAMGDGNHFRRQEALRYLREQPIDDAQRSTVVAKTLPLLSDWHRRGEAKVVLKRWVSDEQTAQVASAANTARARNDRDTQRAAIEILAGIGPSAASHLLPYMNDNDTSLRQIVRTALTEWKVDEKSLAKQCLSDLAAGSDERARVAAQWFAQHVIDDEDLSPKIASSLITLVNNRNTRDDAVKALQLWATADSVPALMEAASVAHSAPDRDAQRACVQLLTKIGDARAAATFAAYLDARHDHNTAKAAFAAIGEDAAPALLPFIHHQDYSVRQTARTLLGEWEVESSQWLAQSMADLKSSDENRRREAIRYITSVEPVEANKTAVAASLIGMVDDERLRRDAMRALTNWATADTVPKLIELLEHEDRGVQSDATRILLTLKDPRSVVPLTAGYGDDESPNRHNAARNIEALGPVAESIVWPQVTNPNWITAKGACELLGRIGTVKSIPILEAAKQHESSFVHSAADRAIAAINDAKREPVALADDDADGGIRKMRTWTDAGGQNKIEALFIEFALGKVRLRTRNGRFLSLKLDQLSPADRQYVMKQVQR